MMDGYWLLRRCKVDGPLRSIPLATAAGDSASADRKLARSLEADAYT